MVLMIPFSTIIYTNETIQNRFNEIITNTFEKSENKKVRSSTLVRKKTWSTSLKLIEEKWITGYGTGSSKKVLQEQYKKDGYDYMYKKNTTLITNIYKFY